ncbi:MAG: exonuclease subunit SbcD [Clostridiales bacterium]|nr:exonuclease subunit SbcD [Clostridiales bacterium]
MKILHTADLHLGKRLNKAARLEEQCDVIKELTEIADAEDIDVVLIAGDIFDTSVPTSEAERVFYRSILTLSGRGRAVICLAGNHDDERRMCAAKPLADLQGIVLAGELDYTALNDETLSDPTPPPSLYGLFDAADYIQKQRIKIVGRYGGVTVDKDGEKVNIALVPYPAEARLSRWAKQDYNIDYAERVKMTLSSACEFFDDNYNILCTHLFLTKSDAADSLGGLLALPVSVLPENADYVALGHVHKHLKVSKKPHAEYSGSPLQYAYDEGRTKSVNIIDTAKRTVEQKLLTSGKNLTEADADNFDECMSKLDFYSGDYVRIKYSGEPLSRDEAAAVRSHPAFNDLVVTAGLRDEQKVEKRAHLSDDEIFDLYYKHRYNAEPSAELKAIFTELMGELKNETH